MEALRYAVERYDKCMVTGFECDVDGYRYNSDFEYLYTDNTLFTYKRYAQLQKNPKSFFER